MPQDDHNTATESTPFANVPVEITISVGKARPSIRELLDLGENAVLSLDKSVDAPVDLFIGDRLIGRGQLEESEDAGPSNLSVRIIEIISPEIGVS